MLPTSAEKQEAPDLDSGATNSHSYIILLQIIGTGNITESGLTVNTLSYPQFSRNRGEVSQAGLIIYMKVFEEDSCPNSAARHVYFVRTFDTVKAGRKSGGMHFTGMYLWVGIVFGSLLSYL